MCCRTVSRADGVLLEWCGVPHATHFLGLHFCRHVQGHLGARMGSRIEPRNVDYWLTALYRLGWRQSGCDHVAMQTILLKPPCCRHTDYDYLSRHRAGLSSDAFRSQYCSISAIATFSYEVLPHCARRPATPSLQSHAGSARGGWRS
jgi:hypothetical protein